MDKAERKRLKQQGKELAEQRSIELHAQLKAENPWPVGSPEWIERYKELHRPAQAKIQQPNEHYGLGEAGSGGCLADFYVATAEDAAAYDDSTEKFTESAQYKRVSPLELSMLWAIMRGVDWDVSLMDEFSCVFQKDDGERLIHKLPAAMLVDLAELSDERTSVLAPKWAAVEELRWPSIAAYEVISDLAKLARRAIESDRGVFLWNCV